MTPCYMRWHRLTGLQNARVAAWLREVDLYLESKLLLLISPQHRLLHLVLVGFPLNPGAELSTSAQNVGKTCHYIHHTLLWIMHLPIGSQWIHHQYLHILTITILTD